ncbi:ABC transporter ATP-binding protein [Verticiella sediminum]|uniref:ABC transporter ATP-binding protein n=1 Tax=Verticiella sediminum TaxID=1247510 RepID=A0A556A5V4_9BURK|nr:ABC transporter ATP-binding protein [Verticiella sediminum]TSH88270.1 ABC transporter ATP-binding protein [Verticiella sediminum]
MLEIQHLAVAYGSRRVIPDLSVAGLREGTVTSLLGPNGSGKSTLLKALAGLTRIAEGRVVLDGEDLTRASFELRARKVVYLPQSLPAAVHLRVFESVLVAANASVAGAGRGEVGIAEVQALLDRLGVGHLAMRFIDELSGGQKQLVGLAQALIRRPRLLLLDEPLSALDLNYQFHVMDLLAQETRENDLITVIVLHDLNIALRHTDHALMIRSGALLAEGSPAQVVTSQTLAAVYGVDGRVEACSRGYLQVVIDGLHRDVA